MNISARFTLMGAGSILATVGVLITAGIWQGGVFHAKAQQEVDRLVATELTRTTQSTYDLVRSQDQSLTGQEAHDQAVADYIVRQEGGLRISSSAITWKAINQFTHAQQTLVVPQMLIGRRHFGQNKDLAHSTPLVDKITNLTGARATVFQRLADGDLLRVATTIETLAGRRAIGTFIPLINPDGTRNSVAESIGHDRVYRGNAYVVNAWYVSQYTPLLDSQRRIIGAIYTGVKQEQAQALRQTILATRVGKTGAVYVLCGTGPQQGTYRIPPPGAMDRQSVWHARDQHGFPYIQTAIAHALTLAPGQTAAIRYLAPASPGSPAAWHVADVAYYRPWDWVIVVDSKADDFKDLGARLRAGQATMSWTFLILGLILATGGGWFLWRATRPISVAAGEVARAAQRLAGGTLAEFSHAVQSLGDGNLDGAETCFYSAPLPVRSRDELGAMASSFNEMQARLTEATDGLERARDGLRQARAELVAANASLEERVAERTATLGEAEERTRLAIEAAHLGTWDLDMEHGLHTCSRSTWQMLGFPTPPADGSCDIWEDLVHPDDRVQTVAQLNAACAGTADYEAEYRVIWPDKSVHWLISKGRLERDEAERPCRLHGVCRDITLEKEREAEREKMLAEALEQADHCPLTGLLNHRAFHKRLEEESDRASRTGNSLAVAIMDLNNFKFFNDAYGHLAGDEVLRQVARALRDICRPGDTVARFGGDEFAVLMPGTDAAATARFGDRLRMALADSGYRPPDYETTIPIEVSLGTAVYIEEAATRLDTLALADTRLRRAKTGGESDESQGFVERVHSQFMHGVSGYSMLDALVTAVDNKDRYTRKHSEDVMAYSLEIAHTLELDDQTQQTIAMAALLHDVGKIGVPDHILRKPGKLTPDEYEAMKLHPMMGAAIVQAVPGFENTLDAVRHHHERWDGDGYPFGLRGKETPLIARLMAVADAFSAMTTDRPYRKGMAQATALAIIEDGAGTQWDPECVQAFLQSRRSQEDSRIWPCLVDEPPFALRKAA